MFNVGILGKKKTFERNFLKQTEPIELFWEILVGSLNPKKSRKLMDLKRQKMKKTMKGCQKCMSLINIKSNAEK